MLVGDNENAWATKSLTEWIVVPGTLYYDFTNGLFCSLTTGECAGENSSALVFAIFYLVSYSSSVVTKPDGEDLSFGKAQP